MPTARAQRAAEDFNRFAECSGAPAQCDADLEFARSELSRVAAIWREKANGRQMPLRQDMNAHALKAFLPNVIIMDAEECGATRRYRTRLVGTTIARVLGDHTGRFIDQVIVSPFRERWCAALDAALAAGDPLRIWGRVDYLQQNYLAIELLLAPIGSSAGVSEAVLVVGYASFSAPHVFDPLARDTFSGAAPYDPRDIVIVNKL